MGIIEQKLQFENNIKKINVKILKNKKEIEILKRKIRYLKCKNSKLNVLIAKINSEELKLSNNGKHPNLTFVGK